MSDVDESIRSIEQGLGHEFADIELLADALTHSSFANERPELARTDNERLEFMGDAVLQWAISALLWESFPGASAGEMTRRRAELVCEDGLSEIARGLDLGAGLRLGRGEERSGGRDKPRLLASALEACMAAVYLDGGSGAAMSVCQNLFSSRVLECTAGERDFKTRMQETMQREGRRPPRYELVAKSGPDHARTFEVALLLDSDELARGEGRSKLEAEQAAAAAALQKLEEGGVDADESAG